jgi:hypothetical protein
MHCTRDKWSRRAEKLIPKHLQEKFRKMLKAQKTKEPQARAASTRIESMTAEVKRTVID